VKQEKNYEDNNYKKQDNASYKYHNLSNNLNSSIKEEVIDEANIFFL